MPALHVNYQSSIWSKSCAADNTRTARQCWDGCFLCAQQNLLSALVSLLVQRTPQETLYKIKTQEVSYPAELSEGATAFIKAALVRDPERRASLTDLLKHPWLLKNMRSTAGPPHMRGRTQTQVRQALGLVHPQAQHTHTPAKKTHSAMLPA